MSKRPVVLISSNTRSQGAEFTDFSLDLSMNYPSALAAAGALPWVAPCVTDRDYVAQVIQRSDGVVLTGGPDVAPERYAKRLPTKVRRTVVPAHPDRETFELALIDEVLRQRKPLLCICRGHQLLNVALGGTLIADIPLQIPQALNHSRTEEKDKVVHQVSCAAGSLIARIAGAKLGVNSSHHQAVAKMAPPLQATAISRDGIIEGMELGPMASGLLPFLLSVQFHPERLYRKHTEHLRIFKSFAQACSRQRRSQV